MYTKCFRVPENRFKEKRMFIGCKGPELRKKTARSQSLTARKGCTKGYINERKLMLCPRSIFSLKIQGKFIVLFQHF